MSKKKSVKDTVEKVGDELEDVVETVVEVADQTADVVEAVVDVVGAAVTAVGTKISSVLCAPKVKLTGNIVKVSNKVFDIVTTKGWTKSDAEVSINDIDVVSNIKALLKNGHVFKVTNGTSTANIQPK